MQTDRRDLENLHTASVLEYVSRHDLISLFFETTRAVLGRLIGVALERTGPVVY
jgi:hypothetical protein